MILLNSISFATVTNSEDTSAKNTTLNNSLITLTTTYKKDIATNLGMPTFFIILTSFTRKE